MVRGMKREGKLSMAALALISMTLTLVVEADPMYINPNCEAPYSEVPPARPCTMCSVCVKRWNNEKRIATNTCPTHDYFYTYVSAVGIISPFVVASDGTGTKCITKRHCQNNTDFKCRHSVSPDDWRLERVTLMSGCKCRCDATHYGQACDLTVPPHLSIDSIADVQNIVYEPNTFVTDFTSIYVYFYNKGINPVVNVQTEFQDLMYDASSCRTDVPQLKDLCGTLFRDGGIREEQYMSVCAGGPTFAEHEANPVCAVVVNIAFPKDRVSNLNSKKFLFDDDSEGNTANTDENAVAKIEKVSVTVYNRIPDLSEGGRVLSTFFGITVVYRSKLYLEDCPVMVTIPQYSKKSERVPSFPRSQEISLTNMVVLEKIKGCQNLGEPVTDWFVWIFKINHDEKNDHPFRQLLKTPTLTFEPFSLAFGKYKVKSVVRFVERNFHEAFAHCYFEITPIPLQPIIFGGSLRYIYYKSNIDLISEMLVDPNHPINSQPKLTRVWSCDDDADILCDKISGEKIFITKYGPFKPGKSYHFTMSVQSPLLALETSYQTIIVSKDPIPNLLIQCLRNCGGKGFKSDTREIFYFKVLYSNQTSKEIKKNYAYNWTYCIANSSFVDVLDIRQEEETPSWILIVNENTLKDNQEYTFKVTGGGEISGEAQITVQMFKYADKFLCKINPKSGIAGQTKFSIECNKADFEQNYDLSLNVYFYDKLDKADESGRLLGSNFMESIEDIFLTRGIVMVCATNMFGQFQTTHVKASLTFPSLTPEFLNESMQTLYRLSENEGYSQKLSYISSLCDILNKEPSTKENYIETLLEVIDEEDSIDLVHLELLISATLGVICNGNNCTNEISDRSYKLLSEILVDVSDKLVRELQRTANGKSDLPSYKVNLLYTSLLKCSGVFLSVQNKALADSDSVTIDFNLYNLYKVGNMKVMKSMMRVNEALAINNIPFIKHSTVQTELVETWMKEDTPIYFTQGTKGNSSGSYLIITKALANSLRKVSSHIVVHVMAFKKDPYWWSQTQDVSTQVVSLAVGYTKNSRSYTPIKSFTYPIDIFLKKNENKNVTVSGAVTQPDSENALYNKDLAVNVHQIYALKGEKISLKFVDLEVKDVFKVSVTKNLRPDYEMVLNGIEVSYQSPWYYSPRNIRVTKDDDVIFVGILPGNSVPANETRRYKFELQSARCQVWYDFLWDVSGCSLGPNSSTEFLHCQCTHLSSIAGFLSVPVNTINPLTDFKLFLSIPENPFVLMFILGILLIYLIFLIWSCIAGKRDLLRTSIIVLEDNISSDSYGYLVVVFTGSRFYAGTTSHIGIVLHGSQTYSRSHILKTSQRTTLSRGNDDWFLLYTPKHLGTISSVQLWSDHTGTSPNWFCDRIHVHDVSANRDYSFLVGKWFGVTQRETRVESFTRPIQLDRRDHVVNFFLTNIVYGFRESHIWVSILMKHPRSPMTRSQRLSLAMVALVTTLLGCILFYDASMPEDEDVAQYNVTTREVLISIYTMCISIVVTSVVFFAFSKSYKYEAAPVQRSRRSTKMAGTRVQVDSADTLRQRKKATRGYNYYIKKAIISLRQDEFYPVRAKTGRHQKEEIIVHKVRLSLAWTLCICAILVSCFFTVWVGLKIGKNKSLLWLTSIGMSLAEDTFLVDPIKILTIALLFGMVQTQLCDLYAYDPNIYDLRKSLMNQTDRDLHILRMKLKPLYKPAFQERVQELQDQQKIVKKWWTQIDIFDVVFSLIFVFCILERATVKDYFYTNSVFTDIVFKGISINRNLTASPVMSNVSRYSMYLQDTVFSAIYCKHWYNKHQLSEQHESFAKTGWVKTLTHRMIGVPRLRQIRVLKEACTLPSALRNLSIYCNVLYSPSTEDTEYYSTQWKSYTSDYVDVVFEKSPWVYTFPEDVSASEVAGMYSESGELFHGGGYIAELTRTRRRSAGTLINLEDLDWMDIRTRITFFEMSTYNVNNNVFTAIIVMAEHLENSLVLASKTVRSIVVQRDNTLLEVVYFLYSVIILIKLLMVLNTVGPQVFFTSFWTLYDLCFVLVGLVYCVGYRVIMEIFADYINEFQRSEKEVFFPFSGMFFIKTLDRYIMALLFVFAIARSLRPLTYASSIIHIKHWYTLYFAWPQILCVSFVLMSFMFSYQRLLEYLVNCLYPLGTSHWLQHKMNFHDLQRATVAPDTLQFFVYIPCCLSCLGLVFYIMVLVESFSRANAMYFKIMQDETF